MNVFHHNSLRNIKTAEKKQMAVHVSFWPNVVVDRRENDEILNGNEVGNGTQNEDGLICDDRH